MVAVFKLFYFCLHGTVHSFGSWFGNDGHFIMVLRHSFLTFNWFVTIKTLNSATGMFAVMILLDNSRVLFLMALHASFVFSKGRGTQCR